MTAMNSALVTSQLETESNLKMYGKSVRLIENLRKQVENLLSSSGKMTKASQNLSDNSQQQAASVEQVAS
ncbi:MAG: hypothetical protein ACRCUT_12085, partial [Spirochaetota bacterium]